jgi:dienelactone hydrolase
VLALALRRRLVRLLGRERNAFADTPRGLALSPSARHFADYAAAPLALRFRAGAREEARAWQQQARAKLAELAGYARAGGIPEAIEERVFPLPGGLSRRRLYLRVRAGVDIPVHLISADTNGVRPAMICLQGTNTGAHLSWGEVRFPDDIDKRRRGYDIAVQAARRGYLAVAIEQACFGERGETQIVPRSDGPCVDAAMHAFLLGRSLVGERSADISAVVDWLIANAAALRIDGARIYAMGHSAGGASALFAAALDPRIAGVLACGCLGFIRNTIGKRRDSEGQGVIPGILNWMETADIVGLIAPRPFVTVAGESDHIWPAAGARAVVDEARAIHAALGAADLIACVSAEGGHNFRPALSWRAFDDVLARAV